MNDQRNNGKGIFYGVIGVATLIVAIIGATFAYFTAQQSNTTTITGNAATVSFGLRVEKVTDIDETLGGIVPMTDGMLAAAVAGTAVGSDPATPCRDQEDHAVCQIYKITLTNTGSARVTLDGYVNLTGGAPGGTTQDPTNMRWAQVFKGNGDTYSLVGTPSLADGATGISEFAAITTSGTSNTELDSTGATGSYTLAGNTYPYINKNYMRTSGHTGETYARTDLTSALVFNQVLAASGTADLYIVVWLSETGANQNLADGASTSFFNGEVVFNSAGGTGVTATFNGYTVKTAA